MIQKCSTNDTVSFRILQETAKLQKYRRKYESERFEPFQCLNKGGAPCASTPSPLLFRSLLPPMHRRLTLLSIAACSLNHDILSQAWPGLP